MNLEKPRHPQKNAMIAPILRRFLALTPTVENGPTVGIKEVTPTVEIKTPTVEIKIVWQNFAATPTVEIKTPAVEIKIVLPVKRLTPTVEICNVIRRS